jgi:hypothetical protein
MIIHAHSLTKNEKKERDPEMHQTKKQTSGTSEPKDTSTWIPEKVLYIRCAPARPAFPMFTCCRLFCTTARGRCGPMRAIRDRLRRLIKPRPGRRI